LIRRIHVRTVVFFLVTFSTLAVVQYVMPRFLFRYETGILLLLQFCVSVLVAALVQRNLDMRQMRHLHDRTTLEQHMAAMKVLVASLEQQDETTQLQRKAEAMFRHDMRHWGQMLLTMLDNNELSAAKEIIQSVARQVEEIDKQKYMREMTGVRLIDAVLCHYMEVGRISGVAVDINMHRIDEINADMTELAVTLSNALENAINACKNMPPTLPRKVAAGGRYHGSQYFIEVANTTRSEVRIDPKTALPIRAAGAGDGLGTQSIQYFVQKHNAQLTYEYHNGWVYMRLLI